MLFEMGRKKDDFEDNISSGTDKEDGGFAMFDWDVVIVGAGPAGLTAGLYLSSIGSSSSRKTLLAARSGMWTELKTIRDFPKA